MQSHESWLKIARDDLSAAKALVKVELFSQATYHCQQSAEKSLKAYLVLKKQPTIKTHDLIKLVELCMKFDKSFATMLSAAENLNSFSTKFRYPTEYDVPDSADVMTGINYAKVVLTFVVAKVEAKETGQTDLFKSE